MLKYLMVVLCDESISYCHYHSCNKGNGLMPVDVLQKGIIFAMKNDLRVHLIYPYKPLPTEYDSIIKSFKSTKIKPYTASEQIDIAVVNGVSEFEKVTFTKNVICRIDKNELFDKQDILCKCFNKSERTNLVMTDIETFKQDDFDRYKDFLQNIPQSVDIAKHKVNVLSDRLEITSMNNCNAGVNNITLAPNGKFYVCPGFYYSNDCESVGDINTGVDIKNKRLYKLEYAPICSHCDAFHCKRCVWLNQQTTLEVNTPSHEQCVVSHLERNATKEWLHQINDTKYNNIKIKELSYLDPFDEYKKWQI